MIVAGVNEQAVRNAVDQANLNVLRLALYQATGDVELAQMKVNRIPLRGGAFFGYVVDEAHHERLKEKAVAYLLTEPSLADVRVPDDEELRGLMALLTSEPLTDGDFRMGREELAFDEFPRGANWSGERPSAANDRHVLIVGAGASGIASAIQFERLGIRYSIVERQDGIGGTWNLNRYPDARVDTNSYLYQFKFEKNYPWTEYFASQGEVKSYLEHIAKKYGVYDKIQFSTQAHSAVFDETSDQWTVEVRLPSGESSTVTADFVVSAAGMFSTPKLPEIPGVEKFTGEIFHTTAWDDDYDPAGRRIAVIGNGSTGVQLMPKLAEGAEQLFAFQRTPQWISPMELYRQPISDDVRWLFDNMPGYWNWYCYSNQMTSSGMQGAQEYDRTWQALGGAVSARNDGMRDVLQTYISTKLATRPDLIAKTTPDYAPLARRLVVDNGWYDALLQPNVELVTDGIDRIVEDAIITRDGKTYPVDTIVAAAGFQVTKYLWPTEYRGRDGVSMEERWETDGPRAFLGLTVPGFPNLFIFYGPNSQPRAGSFLSWIEIWSRYAAQAIADVIEGGYRTIDVKSDVFERYNDVLDNATHEIIWEKEAPQGKNYYVNKFGRQNVNVPFRNGDYYLMVERPNLDHFHLA